MNRKSLVVVLASCVLVYFGWRINRGLEKQGSDRDEVSRLPDGTESVPPNLPARGDVHAVSPLAALATADETESENGQSGQSAPVSVGAFKQWAERFLRAPGADSSGMTAEGEALARQRRAAMEELIRTDPRRAIEMAAPSTWRDKLPPTIAEQLEQRVSGVGNLSVVIHDDFQTMRAKVTRTVTLAGRSYDAYVYGRREGQVSEQDVYLHGIAVGKRIVVHEDRLRRLEAGEPIPADALDQPCSISGQPAAVNGTPVYGATGTNVESFCGPAHFALENERLAVLGSSGGGNGGGGSGATPGWSVGMKNVLLVRVNFTNHSDARTLQESQTLMSQVDNWFRENSYEQTGLTTTFIPDVQLMPRTTAEYETAPDPLGALVADGMAVAANAGYNLNNYDRVLVHHKWIGGGGQVGGKGAYFFGSLWAAVHEVGHTYGLWHANGWQTTSGSLFSPGSNVEYADAFDVMGHGGTEQFGAPAFNAASKYLLGWLSDSDVPQISSSGVYRIYAHDVSNKINGQSYGFRLRKNAERSYWGEIRQALTDKPNMLYGLILHWNPWRRSAGGTHILHPELYDPYGSNDYDTPVLYLGRTFSDRGAGLHLTPIARGGTAADSWMDVQVNLGPFVGNRAPSLTLNSSQTAVGVGVPVTFTVTSSDLDGDLLVHSWTFDVFEDFPPVAPSTLNVTKSWTVPGDYLVRCVVSDKKGGVASAYRAVKVGSPTSFRATGHIVGTDGNPLEGVVMNIGWRMTHSDSAGDFLLTSLYAGGQLIPRKHGFTFSPSSIQVPIGGAGSIATGLNFTATELPKVTITVNKAVVVEDCADSAVFTVSRTGSTAAPLNVNLVRMGTAGYPYDYTTVPALGSTVVSVTIPAGASSVQIVLTPLDDNALLGGQNEGPETVALMLAESDSYQNAWPAEAVVTIQEKAVAVDFAPSVVRVCESGSQGAGWIMVSRSGPTAQPLTVDLDTSGTAVLGTHYEILLNGSSVATPAFSLTIPSGASSQSFAVQPINGAQQDGARSVVFNFRCSDFYRPGTTRTATVWLQDDESSPSVQLSSSLGFVLEGSNNPEATFTVTRSEACLTSPLAVGIQIGGTAVRGVNYEIKVNGGVVTSQPLAITIPAGAVSASFVLRALSDGVVTQDRIATCTIVSSATYVIGASGAASVTVQDAELPVLNLADFGVESIEESQPASPAPYLVQRSGNAVGLSQPVTINMRVRSSSTATFNQDFNLKTNNVAISTSTFSLHLPANVQAVYFDAYSLQDTWAEPMEIVEVEIVPNPNYRVTSALVVFSISDDGDPGSTSVSIAANDAVAMEPDGLVDNGAFAISRTGGSGQSMTVTYSVSGSAMPNFDYQALSGSASLAANQASVTIPLVALNDSYYERNETVVLQINSGAYTIGTPASATVTIVGITDLGIVPGQSSSYGLSFNSSKTIVGQSGTHAFRDVNQSLDAGDDLHAAVTQFYNSPGTGSTIAWDISDTDKTVGEWNSGASTYAWYRGHVSGVPTYQHLTFSGGTENHVRGVAYLSSGGQAAGWSKVGGYHRFVQWIIYDNNPSSSYAYNIGGSFWPSYDSYAYAVTDSRLVGYVEYPSGSQAVLWDWNYSGSGPTYLPRGSGDTFNRAYDIVGPASGYYRAVGESGTASTRSACYWYYSSFGYAPIVKLSNPNGWNSVARGANSASGTKIVGTYHQSFAPALADQRAALWDSGSFVDLYTIFLPAGWTLYSAEKIDDAGNVIGYGFANGQVRAFMLRP